MSEAYQAVRDAFAPAARAVREAADEIRLVADGIRSAHRRPSVLYRPTLSIDGDQWCALYGDNLQAGVAGFGSTPAAAMEAFDRAWLGVSHG